MRARFILGPAGSGKTFRCLEEIRSALLAAPEGPPLLLIAPNQSTYQLERQLLAGTSLAGYTRLQILSFERLALFIFERLLLAPPRLLDEEGRLMVLRSLLAGRRDDLKLFRASARLTGFAQHLSLALRELQRNQLTPESLAELAEHVRDVEGLSLKLQDLATLLRDYLDWLKQRELQDSDSLVDNAARALREPHSPLALAGVWVDGFTELSPQELDLLTELLPETAHATVTFCLDRVPTEKVSWLSNWSLIRRAYADCHKKFAQVPDCRLTTELLSRRIESSRFSDSSILRHLEAQWGNPRPLAKSGHHPHTNDFESSDTARLVESSLCMAACANPEAEATLAAQEILQFVRAGGRYREAAVLVRDLDAYHQPLVNIFTRYEIPFFLDRRESISHHPLAELTRNALRTVALSWARNDWFAALKTGLVPASEAAIDLLENEALARGWKGATWQDPLTIPENSSLANDLERVRRSVVPPFNKLAVMLGHHPTGAQLALALREFWQALRVAETLEQWSTQERAPIHLTVWEEMNAWLDNVDLAFPKEALPLREWLPILETGLAGLTAGVIPPALDQVLIGSIDRSRNSEIRLALVLGLNENVFPAPPQSSVLLTDSDRAELERQGISLVAARQQLSRERYYGYVAFSRARERLILTYCAADSAGKTLNPSPFLPPFKQLFPTLEFEEVSRELDWRQSEHASELIAPLLRGGIQNHGDRGEIWSRLNDLPALAPLRERLDHLVALPIEEKLSPSLAERLYGPSLRTSVSRMEQFAACPFRFFVHSGLRAQERKLFELDIRDQGNFQHEILAAFHAQLRDDQKRWRDITPAEARKRIKGIAAGMLVSFRDGLLLATDEGKFTARVLTESLQDFVETLIGWMANQYAFDPMQVELPFGDSEGAFPPWDLDLGEGHHLLLNGRIDRIDLFPQENDAALCVVVDYKSSQKQLDSLLMQHGLQLQLPGYLNVLRHWPNPKAKFGVSKLIPAGVFYVNLRGKYAREENRDEALVGVDDARKLAYSHSGRFDLQTLPQLDQRKDVSHGDQFNYRIRKDGALHGSSQEAMDPKKFMDMLDGVETALEKMGRAIYAGVVKVDPYRKGTVNACNLCEYQAICRIDPWTHSYRVLRKDDAEKPD